MKKTLLLIVLFFLSTQLAYGATQITGYCTGTWVPNGDGTQSCVTNPSAGTGSNNGNNSTVAQTNPTNITYTPLEPIPGATTGPNGSAVDFPTLLKNMFTILFTIGALFSVVMLTVSGIRYMLSDIVTDKSKALSRIRACLVGLLLLAVSWLILNTINPQLLVFSLNPCPAGSSGCTIQAAPANNGAAPVQTVSASSIQSPTGGAQILNPIQYSNQDSSNQSVAQASVQFLNQCQQAGGTVIQVPGSSAGTTAETCEAAPGLY